MKLQDLEVYKIACEIADKSWEIYERMDWQDKKVIGHQFITAIDSIGANIAEGFGRFHYLDKNKFHYNARGSLFESLHHSENLFKRNKINKDEYIFLEKNLNDLSVRLNNYIATLRGENSKKD